MKELSISSSSHAQVSEGEASVPSEFHQQYIASIGSQTLLLLHLHPAPDEPTLTD
jgi:hypothetical protein